MSDTPRVSALSKDERHKNVEETRSWCWQYKLLAMDLERELAAAQADAQRLDFVLPIICGSNDYEANKRTTLLGYALMRGLNGRDAIDDAMREEKA
jgi:hypothetical protein